MLPCPLLLAAAVAVVVRAAPSWDDHQYDAEREVLTELYNATNGAAWRSNINWTTTDDHCDWCAPQPQRRYS